MRNSRNLLLTLIACVTISIQSFAQAPQSFKYQAVLRDYDGRIIADQEVWVRLSIVQQHGSGPTIYRESTKQPPTLRD